MHREQAITIPRVVVERVIRGNAAMNMLLVIGASVLLAISAQIAVPVPFSPVPLTLQPLAVLLIGVALGSTRAAAAVALYLLEGASGLPVFALGRSGLVALLGPTAGYLYAHPVAAWLAGWFSEHNWTNSRLRATGGLLLALAVMYTGGWAWLVAGLGMSPKTAFGAGIVPFIIADVIKVAIVAMLLPHAQKIVAKLNG
jgi:biotin transport system substrate-specific component